MAARGRQSARRINRLHLHCLADCRLRAKSYEVATHMSTILSTIFFIFANRRLKPAMSGRQPDQWRCRQPACRSAQPPACCRIFEKICAQAPPSCRPPVLAAASSGEGPRRSSNIAGISRPLWKIGLRHRSVRQSPKPGKPSPTT